MLACEREREREREKRNTYRVLMGRPKGKRLLETSSHIWEIILKWQVADISHIGTSSSHLWFRIMDTHYGRGKSISSI